jgi:hypothetical protein
VLPTDKCLISAEYNWEFIELPEEVASFMDKISINKIKEDRQELKARVDRVFDR